MSGALPLELCSTCLERPVRWADECMTCALYRRRTGKQRPWTVIAANERRRSQGLGNAGPAVLAELRSTLRDIGALHPASDQAAIVCVPCGTVKSLRTGDPFPLCPAHQGWLALIGTMLDEEWDRERLREAVSA